MLLPPFPTWLPLIALLISALSLVIAASIAVGQRRALRRFLGAVSEPELRQAVLRAGADLGPLAARVAAVEAGLTDLAEASTGSVAAPGVVRFQAFDADGPALSFSVALLDRRSNGVILTSLHARDRVRLYAKEIRGGASEYTLSEEEAQAMRLALDDVPARPAATTPRGRARR